MQAIHYPLNILIGKIAFNHSPYIDVTALSRHVSGMRLYIPFLCLLSGCTTLSTQLPDVSPSSLAAERAFQEKQVFAEIIKRQERLDRLSYKILSANKDLCDKTGPSIGAATHSLKSYHKKLRPAAARELGAGEEPRILSVRAGSPADKAGLKPGDILKGPKGKPLAVPSKAFSKLLGEGGKITRHRGGAVSDMSFKPVIQCNYPVRLKMSPAINAFATGKSIVMMAGMMDFTTSDDELALIIGHELAHNEKGHIRKILTNYALSLGGSRYARPFESEADYVGLYYTARAGFNLDNIEDVWRRLAKTSARPIARAKTHPTYPDRYVRLAAARDEISAKIAAGEILVPNKKVKK